MTSDPISRMLETGECDHVRPMLEAAGLHALAKALQDQKLSRNGRPKSPHADRREEVRAQGLALREANPKTTWKEVARILAPDFIEFTEDQVFRYVQGRFRS